MWVNVYKGHVGAFALSRHANRHAGPERIGLIHIVIEGDDFTVEKVMK